MRTIIFLDEESGYWKCPHCGITVHSGRKCPNCDDVEGGRPKGYEDHPHSDKKYPSKKKDKAGPKQITMFDK